MIKVNDISDYQSLMVIKKYCQNKQDCDECREKCKLHDICDCMEIVPAWWKIEFPHEVSENE